MNARTKGMTPFNTVAKELGISRRVLELLVVKSGIPPTITVGRKRLFSPSAVEKLRASIS